MSTRTFAAARRAVPAAVEAKSGGGLITCRGQLDTPVRPAYLDS